MQKRPEHVSRKEQKAVQPTDQQSEVHQADTNSPDAVDFTKIYSQQASENIASGESGSSSRQEGLSGSMFQHALRRGLLEEGSTETTMPSSSQFVESTESPRSAMAAYTQQLERLITQGDARLRALQRSNPAQPGSASYQLEEARRRIEPHAGKRLRPKDNAQFDLSPEQKKAKVDFEKKVADFKARPHQGEPSGLSNELRPEDISSSSGNSGTHSDEEGV
jgi:hypothetical protein